MKRFTVLLAGLVVLARASFPTISSADQQAVVVTDANLNEMIAKAKTPADHEAIAARFDVEIGHPMPVSS